MVIRKGRGRPRRVLDDVITPELARNHAAGVTRDAVDQLLVMGWITPEQHQCAMRLRYWRAVVFGVAAPRAVQWGHTVREGRVLEDADRDYFQALYLAVQDELLRANAWPAIAAVCFDGVVPYSLRQSFGAQRCVSRAFYALENAMRAVVQVNRKEKINSE